MKKIFLLFAILISIFSLANTVDSTQAKKAALNFLKYKTEKLRNVTALSLVYKTEVKQLLENSTKSITCFYVFNVTAPNTQLGFVMIAADNNVLPILGYSDESNFNPNDIPINAAKWYEGYKQQIENVIINRLPATEEITKQWDELLNSNFSATNNLRTTAVSPLIQTKWNQSPYYNDLCPRDTQLNKNALTGCVATAMAQIMKFHNYPNKGFGFYSYNHDFFGTQSAIFGATNYDWSNMPISLTSTNTLIEKSAIATLMYHCGVSVDMDYGINGSGAETPKVVNALKNFFGYDTTVNYITKGNISTYTWLTKIKSELNAGRPIEYRGSGSGGHAFVCDGYNNNDWLHFNWGWGGSQDGYFNPDNLNPGNHNYTQNQAAVVGIKPPINIISYDLRLYSSIVISSNPLNYGSSFNVNTSIGNYGTNNFSGDFLAIIFDSTNNKICYVDSLIGTTLSSNYYKNIVFSNSGNFNLLPGTYKIGIFFRANSNGKLVSISNNSIYLNFQNLTVINQKSIEMNSAMKISPVGPIIKGQSLSVNLNIKNSGTTTFKGVYDLSLYNLDGTYAQRINYISENNGLPPGYTYSSPFLTFSNSNITVNKGSYLLAVQHKVDTSSTWQLTGSSNSYSNPVRVTVNDVLSKDGYEPNDWAKDAYDLGAQNNSAWTTNNVFTYQTIGSNLHSDLDHDYFKIRLVSGYNYNISARLHDSYNSGNGQVYTVDALFSYSKDSINWSSQYDDVMPSNITVNGKDTVYFHISPFFPGIKGTYLFDITITRALALPLQFIDFSATKKLTNSYLNWKVSNEFNTDYFDIERSVNSYNWQTLGSVNAKNIQGVNVYDFTDTKPVFDINYYRLKMNDKDGKYTYSPIRTVNFTKGGLFVSIAPNPAVSFTTITFNQPVKNVMISVVDAQGKKVMSEKISNTTISNYQLNTAKLSAGIYTINFNVEDKIYNEKLVIVK